MSTYLRTDKMPPLLASAILDAGFDLKPQMKDGGIRYEIVKRDDLCVECQSFPVHGITNRCKYCAHDKYVGVES